MKEKNRYMFKWLNKTLIFISLLTVIFCILIALDYTPYLRGPAPYPPDWQWEYLFVNTYSRIWLPILVFICGILIIFLINRFNKFNTRIILFLLILFCFCMEISLLYFSRAGIFVLIHRIINPELNGYFTASLSIDNLYVFLNKYEQSVLSLPMHAQGHPPGAILFFYSINYIAQIFSHVPSILVNISPQTTDVKHVWEMLRVNERIGVIISTILIPLLSSFVVIPIYYLGKITYSQRTGIVASLLYILLPSTMLFLPINDVFLSLFPLFSIILLLIGFKKNNIIYPLLSGIVFYSGLFFSLSILPTSIIILFVLLWYREKSKKTLIKIFEISLLPFIVGLILLPTFLYLFFDFNSISLTKTLLSGLPDKREYNIWVLYNLYDFFIFAGVPVLFIFIFSTYESIKNYINNKQINYFIFAFLCMILLLNFSGTVRGEVARIWLPFYPFLVLPVAQYLITNKIPTYQLLLIFILQFIQIIIMTEYWVTLW